jgi:hypothetical protein
LLPQSEYGNARLHPDAQKALDDRIEKLSVQKVTPES